MANNFEGQQNDDIVQQTERDPGLEVAFWRHGARVVMSHEVQMFESATYRERFLAAQAGAAALLHEDSS